MRHAGWSAVVSIVGGLSIAHADATNRNLLPIGEAESLRSNAGIAGASPGSVFHNPAGLARIDHPQLAVSGTTLMYFQSTTDRLIQLDEAVAYEASGFAPIPASLISTYKLGGFALATAILVPDMFQLDNRQRRETPAARVNLAQSLRRQDLWLGVGVARALGERVAVGASVFGVRRTSISNTFFQITVPETEGVFAQTTANETTSITGVAAILGVSIEVAPWVTFGVRIEPPFLQLAATASIFRSQISSDGMATQIVEIDKEQVDINQPVPPDFGLGLAIRPAKNVTIYLDAAVQLAADYTFIDDPELGPPDRVELTMAPRGSVGLDVQPWKKLMLHGGFHYNRGAQRKLEAGGDTVEDFIGGTIGATVLGKRSRTGVGLFMQRSTAQLVPVNAMPGDTEEATTTVVGALITVGYLL